MTDVNFTPLQSPVQFWQASFWNPRKAAARIDANVMPANEKLSYLLISILLLGVLIESSYYIVPLGPPEYDLLISVISIFGMVLGSYYLFKLHKNSSISFLEKYVVVCVSSLFYLLILFAIPYILVMVVLFEIFYPNQIEIGLTLLDVLGAIVINVITFWYLGRFFKQKQDIVNTVVT